MTFTIRTVSFVGSLFMGLIFAAALPARADGTLKTYPDFHSAYVIPRDVTVWVPDGYDPSGPALPVIYMQDGENLFEPSHSLSHADWEVGKTLTAMIKRGEIPPVVVVGMSSTNRRGREYLPGKVVRHLPEATRAIIEASWQGESVSDTYLRFIVEELKPFIDSHYRVSRDASETFIMGSSMGGLISFYAQSEYPKVFGGSASLSMHMLMGEPWKTMIIQDQDMLKDQVTKAFDDYLSESALTPSGHFIYVDRGDQTLDAYYVPFTPGFNKIMGQHGWTPDQDYVSCVFPGTPHNEIAWAARYETVVKALLKRSTKPCQ